jgi:hypothetical protein
MTQYTNYKSTALKRTGVGILHRSLIFKILPVLLFCFLCSQTLFSQTTPINFTFNVSTSSRTSAGVFNSSGTLIRTLWSGVDYAAGTYTKTWDKKDDKGNLMSGTSYTVKVITNNVAYTWEGVVGNTSSSKTGDNKMRHLRSMWDLSFAGTKGYYCTGFVEGNSSANKFELSDIQSKEEVTPAEHGDVNLELNYNATDGNYVYWTGFDGYGSQSFAYATKVSDESEVLFTKGTSVSTQWGRTYTKAIDVQTGITTNNPSGIAVQKTGNFLFISHKGMNKIMIFNKTTGASVTTFSITEPRDLTTDANNDLWVISGKNTLTRYTVNATTGGLTSAASITGLTNPISLSSYSKSLAVADEGTSQVKSFNISNGSLEWTLGKLNGYDSDATVENDKFFFHDNNSNEVKGFVSFGLDGSIWVGDAGNNRVVHFSSSRVFLDQIMYMPMNYNASVNSTDPTRVFSDFQEFKIDYSKPLEGANGSWTLVKNWRPGLTSAYLPGNSNTREVFKNCVTLSNGRTYGTIEWTDAVTEGRFPEVVELVEGGRLRLTGIRFEEYSNNNIAADGTLRYMMGQKWYERKMSGFTTKNDPIWGAETAIATAPSESDAPGMGTYANPEMTSSDLLIVFDRSNSNTGYHLAAVKKGTSAYAWKASPATSTTYTGDFPADGKYDIGNGVEYAGGQVYAAERSIFWNYIGEFWKNSQTNKWNHYYDNGLFINQFGITTPDAEKLDGVNSPRMAAGNAFAGALVKVGSDYYIYHCDESVHGGTHRWKITGLNTIKEEVIPLGSTYAEINIKGNGVDILKGTLLGSLLDNTDFGSITTGSSGSKSYVISNTGTAALSVTGISFSGTNKSEFALVSPPTFPLSIAANSSYTINVKFSPSATGTRNASIIVANSDADESSYDFVLKGLGISLTLNPDLQVSGNGNAISNGDVTPSTTDNTDFGSINNGSTVSKTFVLKNAGLGILSVSGVSFSGTNASEFSVVSAPSYPMLVLVGGTYTFTVNKRLNDEMPLSDALHKTYQEYTRKQLDLCKPGTRLVTFHGDNDEVPDSFAKVKESKDKYLKLWIRR